MKPLVLLGAGGHCKSCIDVIESEGLFEIVGILDIESQLGKKVLGYEIIGVDEDMKKFVLQECSFLITVGQIKTVKVRQSLFSQLKGVGAKLATIISPRAYVSNYAQIGEGSIVMHDALVNASAKIGNNCIINSKALIEHDSSIESHCHISTGAIVNGGTIVKEGTFYGSNAVSKEYVETKPNAFINAGSLFTG